MIAVDTNILVYAHRREAREQVLVELVQRPHVSGAIVHDARIAALCLAHGVEALLTRDRDFSLFPELTTDDPFAAQ